jgi:RND superfamily putative drug exporter
MTATASPALPAEATGEHPRAVGPIGRLGAFAADHARAAAIAWAILAVALGAFAPKIETALSGAGWQADGSESVQARTLIQRNFAGLAIARGYGSA